MYIKVYEAHMKQTFSELQMLDLKSQQNTFLLTFQVSLDKYLLSILHCIVKRKKLP